jgi:hypothetical protein
MGAEKAIMRCGRRGHIDQRSADLELSLNF